MAGDTVVMAGSLGSSQAGLAQWMLSGEEEVDSIIAGMRGFRRVVRDDRVTYERLSTEDPPFSEECCAWFQAHLLAVLGKNVALGRINTEAEKHELAWQMWRSFRDDCAVNFRRFDLRATKLKFLLSQYRTHVLFALTHPLYGGMRGVLTSTTSESTQTVRQNITSSEEKKGLLGGIFGKGGS